MLHKYIKTNHTDDKKLPCFLYTIHTVKQSISQARFCLFIFHLLWGQLLEIKLLLYNLLVSSQSQWIWCQSVPTLLCTRMFCEWRKRALQHKNCVRIYTTLYETCVRCQGWLRGGRGDYRILTKSTPFCIGFNFKKWTRYGSHAVCQVNTYRPKLIFYNIWRFIMKLDIQ